MRDETEVVRLRRARRGDATLTLSPRIIATQHVAHKKIEVAVEINIRSVHSHRTEALMPQCLHRREREASMPVVPPEPIRRVEIVADINVRRTVTVEIADLYGQPRTIHRPGRQRTFRHVEVGIIRHFETAATVIQQQHVRLTFLIKPLALSVKLVLELRRKPLAIPHALPFHGQLRSDLDVVIEIGTTAVIADVDVQCAVAIHVRHGDGCARQL